ncbi:hypothetical protein KCU65_g4437, partial [Aureobasidium melanogenum]
MSLRLEKSVLGMIRGKLKFLGFEEDHSSRGETPLDNLSPIGDTRPAVLKLRIGASLLCFLLLLLVALTVLYWLSLTTGLHQAPVLYQMHVNLAQASATLAPYSIVPTLLAICAKLWFAVAGDTVQRYQPYITMIRRPTELSKSISVEYMNTPTTLVSLKALKCSHWLLALIGAGAFATEAFTVSMSALWYRELRHVNRALEVNTPLTLRTEPSTQNMLMDDDYYLLSANETRDLFIPDLYDTSLQNWLYSATIEITQSAVTPAWSKDVWGFVPRNFSNDADVNGASGRNTTLQTTALKASLICRPQTYPADPSLWLTKIDFQDSAKDNATGEPLWNKTNSPPGLAYGYILKNLTDATLNMESLNCCANETSAGVGSAAIGYWSNANGPELTSTWIEGLPLAGYYTPYYTDNNDLSLPSQASEDPVSIVGPLKPELFVWQETLKMAAISCEPLIEEAEAMLTVEMNTGVILDYQITSALHNASGAWTYPYTQENLTEPNYTWDSSGNQQNFTQKYIRVNASWGYIFGDALIGSGQQGDWFRFQDPGLNVDLMSYSMLQLAKNDQQALLDPKTLMDTANQTFATFFKHFACFNVTEELEGYVYDYSESTYERVNATISTPIEELRMSPVAAILSMSILIFLIITTTILYSTNRKEYKAIPRDVDTLASTLGWVYASDRLLTWAEHAPPSQPWYKSLLSTQSSLGKQYKAKMGPFMDSGGTERWGIEIVDTDFATIVPDKEDQGQTQDAECATEAIELRDRRLSSSTDVEHNADIDVHERLLDSSDTEIDVVDGAEEHVRDSESDSIVRDDRVRRFSSSDEGNSDSQH